MNLYDEKNVEYYDVVRNEIIDLMPAYHDLRVLEVGSGGGGTLVRIKELGLAAEVVGVDITKIAGGQQSHPLIDQFIFGDIETMNLEFPEEYFDVIICPDVLEHLINPWAAVKKMCLLLKKQGTFIVSIPNIRSLSIFKQIFLKGDFKYQQTGILDKTHLRFFCKKNIIDLLEENGLKAITIINDLEWIKTVKRKVALALIKLSFGLLEEFLVKRYCIAAVK